MRKIIFSVISIFCSFAAMAEKQEAYNPGETIFQHLGDEYEWTMALPNHKSIHIPLPIILRSHQGTWHIFSSARLRSGKQYHGFGVAKEGNRKGKIVGTDETGKEYRPLDLSATKNVLAIFITVILVMFSIFPLARWYKKKPLSAPRKGLGILETVINMVYIEGIKPILGKDAHRFAPYLLTVFFFILYANLLGMIVIFPGGANVTNNIAVTAVLALCSFIVVNVFGSKKYWKEIFFPEVPILLKFPLPIMPLVELIGIFTKSIALMIRLFANILAGHLITLVLISFIFVLGTLGHFAVGATTLLSVAFTVFMNLIDLLVCFIQAYVFMILSTIFISMARE